MEELPTTGKEKKIQVILIVLLVAISVSSVILFTLLLEPTEPGPTGPVLTTTYSSIDPDNAAQLINANESFLIIVDCRTCKCNYNSGHLLNATWNTNPLSYHNTTSDLLVYDNNGSLSIEFCEQLVNHTYGAINYLEGGINAWQNAGYPIEE